jgi:hypothetical protein
MVLTIHISEHVEVESSDEQRHDDKGAVKFRGQDSAGAHYDYAAGKRGNIVVSVITLLRNFL